MQHPARVMSQTPCAVCTHLGVHPMYTLNSVYPGYSIYYDARGTSLTSGSATAVRFHLVFTIDLALSALFSIV